MSRGKQILFSIDGARLSDTNLQNIIQQLVDKINDLETQINSGPSGDSRRVDRQKFRVQKTDKGEHILEVDTDDGIKKISLSKAE